MKISNHYSFTTQLIRDECVVKLSNRILSIISKHYFFIMCLLKLYDGILLVTFE